MKEYNINEKGEQKAQEVIMKPGIDMIGTMILPEINAKDETAMIKKQLKEIVTKEAKEK